MGNSKIKTGEKISFSEAIEKLDFLLQNSVRKQLVSDVPLGVLLSGGLDSSLISSIASKFKKIYVHFQFHLLKKSMMKVKKLI